MFTRAVKPKQLRTLLECSCSSGGGSTSAAPARPICSMRYWPQACTSALLHPLLASIHEEGTPCSKPPSQALPLLHPHTCSSMGASAGRWAQPPHPSLHTRVVTCTYSSGAGKAHFTRRHRRINRRCHGHFAAAASQKQGPAFPKARGAEAHLGQRPALRLGGGSIGLAVLGSEESIVIVEGAQHAQRGDVHLHQRVAPACMHACAVAGCCPVGRGRAAEWQPSAWAHAMQFFRRVTCRQLQRTRRPIG